MPQKKRDTLATPQPVRFRKDQLEKLEKKADESGESVSTVIRQVVDKGLADEG